MNCPLRPCHLLFVFTSTALLAAACGGCERNGDKKANSNVQRDVIGNCAKSWDSDTLSFQIDLLSGQIDADSSDPEVYFERACARNQLSHVGSPLVRFENQDLALADFERAHELAGGDCVVDAKTGRELSPEALNERQTDSDGRILGMPSIRRVNADQYVRVRPGTGEVPVGGPGMPRALIEMAVMLMGQGRLAEARSYAQRAGACDPDDFNVRVLQTYVDGASTSNWEWVHRKLSELVQSDEGADSVFAWISLGHASAAVNRMEEAERAYRKAMALNPGNLVANNGLGDILIALGRHGEAELVLRDYLKFNHVDSTARHNLGIALKEQGRLEASATVLTELVGMAPGFSPGWKTLGDVYAAGDFSESAIFAYSFAIQCAPTDYDAYIKLAAVYHGDGLLGRAEELYTMVMHRDPDYADAYYHAGINYAAMEAYEQAVTVLKKYTELVEADARAWGYLGYAYLQQEKYAEAEHAYEQAVALDPQHAYSLNALGFLQKQKESYDLAMQYYVRACIANPNEKLPLWNANQLALSTGKVDEFTKELTRLIEANIMKPEAMLLLAQSHIAFGDLDEAIRASKSGLALNAPDSAAYLNQTLGFCQLLRGEHTAAISSFKTAATQKNASMYTHLWILLAQLKDGQSAAAQTTIEKLRADAPPGDFVLDLIKFLNREIDENALLFAANSEDDRCEANYYIGERCLIDGRVDDAAAFFRKCADSTATNNMEYILAHFRLHATGKPMD